MAIIATDKPILDIPVTFGGVSFPDTDSGRIAVRIGREMLILDYADLYLCGVQLVGRIIVLPEDVDPDQRHLFAEECPKVEATFSVKGFSVKPDHLSARLGFDLTQVDMATIGGFAKRSGLLQVDLVLGQGETAEDAEERDDQD